MKTILLFTFAFLISSISFSQTFSVGDTTEIELITFETESVYFKQGTPTTNIWQIGEPQKLTFTEAYSEPNAIVTDTAKAYPVNNHSWFDLIIPEQPFYDYIGISFYHKINTDLNADGGYITISYDLGKTWINIISDSTNHFITSPMRDDYHTIKTGLYNSNDTLYDGTNGFSGNIDQWTKVQFNWVKYIAVKKREWIDTVIVRFNFISGYTETAKEGWMIDNIRLFMEEMPGAINESNSSDNLEVFPNPIESEAIIRTKNQQIINQVELYSINGQLLRSEHVESNKFLFKKHNLKDGIYLIKCFFPDNQSESVKIFLE